MEQDQVLNGFYNPNEEGLPLLNVNENLHDPSSRLCNTTDEQNLNSELSEMDDKIDEDENFDSLITGLNKFAHRRQNLNLHSESNSPGTNESDLFIFENFDTSPPGRTRTLSRISEASHTEFHDVPMESMNTSVELPSISSSNGEIGSTRNNSESDFATTTTGTDRTSSLGDFENWTERSVSNDATTDPDIAFDDYIIKAISSQDPEFLDAKDTLPEPDKPVIAPLAVPEELLICDEDVQEPKESPKGKVTNDQTVFKLNLPAPIGSGAVPKRKTSKGGGASEPTTPDGLNGRDINKNLIPNKNKAEESGRQRIGSSSSLGPSGSTRKRKKSSLKRKSSLPIIDLTKAGVMVPGTDTPKKSISFADHVMVHGYQSDPDLYHLDKVTGHPSGVLRSNSMPTPPHVHLTPKRTTTTKIKGETTTPGQAKNVPMSPSKQLVDLGGNTQGVVFNDGATSGVISTLEVAGDRSDRHKHQPATVTIGDINKLEQIEQKARQQKIESDRQTVSLEKTSAAKMFFFQDEEEGSVRLDINDNRRGRASSDTTTGTASSEIAMTSCKPRTNHEDSITSDDVFRPNDPSNQKPHGVPEPTTVQENLKTGLTLILSGLYGILLVVLGFVLPIAETFADPTKPYMFELFYLFLYGVSIAFLMYVYTYLLRKENFRLLSLPKSISKSFSRTFSKSTMQRSYSRTNSTEKPGGTAAAKPSQTKPGATPLMRQNSAMSFGSARGRRRKIAYNAETSHHTGSFYLRVGIIGFGIGSMIHSALTFGHYFEVNHSGDPCSDVVQAIKPFFHLCFTFIQMYFVFMNSKMCVHKYKTLARFGLVHMGGTNICVWLRSIVVEALHVIKVEERKFIEQAEQEAKDKHNGSEIKHFEFTGPQLGSLPELNCHWDAVMGKVVEKSSVYLYPCTIEYSLVCAGVLFVMWSNVGEGGTKPRKHQPIESASEVESDDSDDDNAAHKMSVDCAGSSQGLFMGILLFVASVVCLVCFYVLASTPANVTAANLMGHTSENVVYLVTFLATVIAAYQMKCLHFSTRREAGIEEILTLISLGGLGMYGMFSIVAATFNLHRMEGALTIVTNIGMLVQAGTQATFTLAALRMSAKDAAQVREKPGRQYVTFLLVSNFALWAINTFETQRLEHNLIQVEFYGHTAWSIFSHISVPLGIYFRFHSTVSLSNIWKKAWKMKHLQSKTHLQN